MAPKASKAKVAAKRRLVPKKAVTKATASKGWTSVEPDALYDGEAEEGSVCRAVEEPPRKLRKWGTEEHVQFVIKEKLSGFEEMEVKSARGKTTGHSVKEYIKVHCRSHKADGKNLSGQFWQDFWKEFRFEDPTIRSSLPMRE